MCEINFRSQRLRSENNAAVHKLRCENNAAITKWVQRNETSITTPKNEFKCTKSVLKETQVGNISVPQDNPLVARTILQMRTSDVQELLTASYRFKPTRLPWLSMLNLRCWYLGYLSKAIFLSWHSSVPYDNLKTAERARIESTQNTLKEIHCRLHACGTWLPE